jgi:hypothetical protein
LCDLATIEAHPMSLPPEKLDPRPTGSSDQLMRDTVLQKL